MAFPYFYRQVICDDLYTIRISKCVYEGFGDHDTKITYEAELYYAEHHMDKKHFKPPLSKAKVEGANVIEVFSYLLNAAHKMAHERN